MINALSHLLEQIQSRHSIQSVKVIPEPYAKLKSCYYNVEEKVKRDGGKAIYGRLIWIGNYITEGEMHAVWQSPEGVLLDITPHSPAQKEVRFIPVDNFKFEGKDVPNIRINNTSNSIVDDLISVYTIMDYIQSTGTRIDRDNLLIHSQLKAASEGLEPVTRDLHAYLNKGATAQSRCFCGDHLSYQYCHGKELKDDLPVLFEKVKKIASLKKKQP